MVIAEGLHPVPVVFGTLFALAGLGCVLGFAFTGAVGLLLGTGFFFSLLGFIAWHGLPVRIVLDERGVTWRRKVRTQHVAWSEIASLSTGLEAEGFAGWVTLRLTHTGAGLRKGTPQLSVPAVEDVPQRELVKLIRERWEAAGGSGETRTLVDDLRETTRDLATMGHAIEQLARGEPVEPLRPPVPFRVELGSRVKVTSDADDPIALYSTLWAAGLAQAREQRFNPAFTGALEFVLTTPRTPVLDEQLQKLASHLAAECERVGLRTTGDEPISVSFTFVQRGTS